MKNMLWIVILATACTASKKSRSVHPFQGDQVGCGNFIVYKLSKDNTQLISVSMNMQGITPKTSQSYGLDKAEIVEVKWKVYEGDISAAICNDVRSQRPREVKNLSATSGIVDIYIEELQLEKLNQKEPYKVKVVLRKVAFDGLFINNLRIENVNVGWLPG